MAFYFKLFCGSHSFLFVFYAGSHGLGFNDSRNSGFKEKMAGLACVSGLTFCFLWLCYVILNSQILLFTIN